MCLSSHYHSITSRHRRVKDDTTRFHIVTTIIDIDIRDIQSLLWYFIIRCLRVIPAKCKNTLAWKIIHGISDSATPFVSLMTDFLVHKHKFSNVRDTRGNVPRSLHDHQHRSTFHFRHLISFKNRLSVINIKIHFNKSAKPLLENKAVSENCELSKATSTVAFAITQNEGDMTDETKWINIKIKTSSYIGQRTSEGMLRAPEHSSWRCFDASVSFTRYFTWVGGQYAIVDGIGCAIRDMHREVRLTR